jgi:hypothetical protein
MDAAKIVNEVWFRELLDQVRVAVDRRAARDRDAQPSLEAELQHIRDRQYGWRQTLGNRDLNPKIRAAIELEWETSLAREEEIEAQLAERDGQERLVENLLDPAAITARLIRLSDLLAASNPTLANLELSLHIDRVDCFANGRVEMRTSKLGLLGDVNDLLVDAALIPTTAATIRVKPRRRSRRRTEFSSDFDENLKSIAFTAADPDRFAGLPDQWFWTDVFQVPNRDASWAASNAEAIFKHRQESKLSFATLAKLHGVTPPTIRAAVHRYLEQHPEAVDQVKLQRGGNRPKKFDLAAIGDEARRLWNDGWSKERLAAKYGCSAPTVGKAIAHSYSRDGVPVPTSKERKDARIANARALFDQRISLAEIGRQMKVSDVTIRQWLRISFRKEGKQMRGLRRRGILQFDVVGGASPAA